MKRWIAVVCLALSVGLALRAAADPDGYDTRLAQSVRSATQRYRLVVWARLDGYVQSTDYVSGLGITYTNHDRFDPPSLDRPTVLAYDEAGRLVSCGYQFRLGSKPFATLADPTIDGWYNIPAHLHYNIVLHGDEYFVQQLWQSPSPPTGAELIQRKLMPPNAELKYAFVHPATRALLIWAWRPNPNGLFDTENPSLP